MTELNVYAYSDGDVDTNRSGNPTLSSLVEERFSRRQTLYSGFAATAAIAMPSALLTGCSDEDVAPAGSVQAGQSARTSSGAVMMLSGTASGNFSSLSWSQVSGPTVTIENPTSPQARFLAPSVAAATDLVFQFTGTDGLGRTQSAQTTVGVDPAKLGFSAVAKNLNDIVTVPDGYTVTVLYRAGDPLKAGTSAYGNTGSDTDFASRAGDQHDAIYYYGLAATGNGRDDTNSARGLLVMNHENIVQRYMHANGPTGTAAGQARPEAEALKEIEAHGVSVVEVSRNASGVWSYSQASSLNRRITPFTPMDLVGPVRGNALVRTQFSTDGTRSRGTLNNCANGYTAWGTNLTCEENWAGYFRRRTATDNPLRSAKEITALTRYSVGGGPLGGGAFGWFSVVAADPADTRWRRLTAEVSGPDATQDFRNEANQFGWVVEIDPYDPASTPRKRTALGRFAHEGCWPGPFRAGRRPAFYMGDDARGDYMYKFVAATAWDAADAQRNDRLAVGDKYLDTGTLYVARFNADGSGTWLPLIFGQGGLTAANPAYPFADQADVLINARLAGDAAGATRMDRPEWTSVNPGNGEVYLTLTNGNATSRPLAGTDAANPRHYNDPRTTGTAQRGNPNGHIIRLRETGDTTEATSFTWDIYAFGADSTLDPTNINVSGLDASNDFSSPDGLWFARPSNASGQVTPVLWIQTDDGAFTDVTNCMMLAAMPGRVGDGGARTITNTDANGAQRQQATIIGKAPAATLKRFLVGPKECEVTGVDSTPDGRALFVNIQHPGEDTDLGSSWPETQTNPASRARPRSATVVITRTDGGVVGLS
jgi:uncharacterized protein